MTSYILQLAGPVATIVAATAAVYVTWWLGNGQLRVAERQAQLATIRLQHDLFDRRFEIFEAALSLIEGAYARSNVSAEELWRFKTDTAAAGFLLDESLVKYLSELVQRALDLQSVVKMIERGEMQTGEGKPTTPEQRNELMQWFLDQRQVLGEKFKPVMALDPEPRA